MSKLSPAAKPRHKAQKKRFHARRDPEYASWIRTQPCILLGHVVTLHECRVESHYLRHSCCWGPVQVCHVRSRGAGGDDRGNVVPMCAGAHEEQHRIGIRSFQARWGLDLKAEAARLYQQYLAEVGRA